MKKNYVKKLCISAILAALFVALELLSANFGKLVFLDDYQIPISCFPLILASIMLGPAWGTATAIVGSFISQLSFGLSWSTVVWMIPTVCYSLSVALLFLLFKKSYKPYIFGVELLFSSLLLSCLNLIAKYVDINVLMVNYGYPFGTNKLYDSLWAVFITLKLIGAIAFAIIFMIIIPPLVKKLKKILLVATGALTNASASQQGESIPGIAHAISIET